MAKLAPLAVSQEIDINLGCNKEVSMSEFDTFNLDASEIVTL
jgi:hypothetical protein